MSRERILVVAHDPAVTLALRDSLASNGFDAVIADSSHAAVEAAETAPPDVAILDARLPDGEAPALLPRIAALAPEAAVIVLTGRDAVELGARSLASGAEQFLTKPAEPTALLALVQRALDRQRARRQQVAADRRESRAAIDPFLGSSAAIRRAEEEARLALEGDQPILIEGEAGTGKGVLARWLHENGARAGEAFVDLSCAAAASRESHHRAWFGDERAADGATRGGLELAHRGTLFLDTIGDLDPELQSQLLRVLEERRFRRPGATRDREVDLRLIAATCAGLEDLVRRKRFREDLFYRVNVLAVRMPPLRERREDLRALAENALARLASETGRPPLELSADAAAALESFPWPGNLRELRNALERALLRCDGTTLEPRHLGLGGGDATAETGDLTLAAVERLHIEHALAREGGHVERAAKRLDIPRSTLYQKLKTMGIPLHR